ncbi:MAG: hypothetical protein IPF82_22865 [Blastocatellia bacterium]|nr:hypothetical protein [Blastocatellia bacterium]
MSNVSTTRLVLPNAGARSAPVTTALIIVLICSSVCLTAGEATATSATWRRAYVVDAGLATLRAAPALHARLLKRLRHGRMVAIVERARTVDGIAWVRVAVTRRTRGWIPVIAIASPGEVEGVRRMASRLDSTVGFARLELARLAIDRFPRLQSAARVAFVQEAEHAAALLTKRAARRFGHVRGLTPAELRTRMLLDPLLDRYVRLGVRFEADPATLRYRVLDGRESSSGSVPP